MSRKIVAVRVSIILDDEITRETAQEILNVVGENSGCVWRADIHRNNLQTNSQNIIIDWPVDTDEE